MNLLEWNWVRICTICCHPFVIFLVTVILIQRYFSICKSGNLWNVFSLRKCVILSESRHTRFTLKELIVNIILIVEVYLRRYFHYCNTITSYLTKKKYLWKNSGNPSLQRYSVVRSSKLFFMPLWIFLNYCWTKSLENYINEKAINFYKIIMHIRAQVVKKGRRRKKNNKRNFDNFSKNDMILHEFKYDFKNKNFL